MAEIMGPLFSSAKELRTLFMNSLEFLKGIKLRTKWICFSPLIIDFNNSISNSVK